MYSLKNVLLGALLIMEILFMIPLILAMIGETPPPADFVVNTTVVGLGMIVATFVLTFTKRERSERTNCPDNPA